LLFIILFFELIAIIIGTLILSSERISKKQTLIMFLVGIVWIFFLFPILNLLTFPLLAVVGSIYLYFTTTSKWKSSLWVFISLITVIFSDFLSYAILLGLYNLTFLTTRSGILYDVLYTFGIFIFTIAICAGVRYMLTKFKIKELVRNEYLPLLILTAIAVIGTFFILIWILRDAGIQLEMNSMLGLLFVFIMFVAIILLALIWTIKVTKKIAQVEYEKAQLEQLNESAKRAKEQYEGIRKFRHDYLKILMTIEAFFRNKDYSGLEAYYFREIAPTKNEIFLNDKQLDDLQNLNNLPIQGLLYSKLIDATSLGLMLEIEIPKEIMDISINGTILDLAIMVGIILDNAIEESQDLEDPFVKIGIFDKETHHLIVVENRCRAGLLPLIGEMSKKGYTTKKDDSRGLGLSNLKELVAKYGETINHETRIEEDVFIQKLIIFKN